MADRFPSTAPRSERRAPGDAAPTNRRTKADLTRQAIRDAVSDLLLKQHPAKLSIPAVAEAAGMSVRTVYRYFPTKQDLLDDVVEAQQRQADAILDGRSELFDDPGAYLVALWSDLETDIEVIRAQHISPIGGELRANRMQKLRAEISVQIDKAYPNTPADDRRDLCDLVMMITGSAAFLDLHTRLGHSGADGARLAWWAVRAMLGRFEKDQGIDRSERRPRGTTREEGEAPGQPLRNSW